MAAPASFVFELFLSGRVAMSLDDDDADVVNARQVNRFLLQKPKTWNKNKETRLLFFEKKKHFNRFFFLFSVFFVNADQTYCSKKSNRMTALFDKLDMNAQQLGIPKKTYTGRKYVPEDAKTDRVSMPQPIRRDHAGFTTRALECVADPKNASRCKRRRHQDSTRSRIKRNCTQIEHDSFQATTDSAPKSRWGCRYNEFQATTPSASKSAKFARDQPTNDSVE
jgi:hypothetical protein